MPGPPANPEQAPKPKELGGCCWPTVLQYVQRAQHVCQHNSPWPCRIPDFTPVQHPRKPKDKACWWYSKPRRALLCTWWSGRRQHQHQDDNTFKVQSQISTELQSKNSCWVGRTTKGHLQQMKGDGCSNGHAQDTAGCSSCR
jgi:hypothetical protein